ncbi:hypothetical protein V1264_011803 [Littorina saxatilis]|uniref:Transposase n=1 Tax=Littorina saxatilis TaxID=31220 RepID=A0AAN9BVI4_9CAEN
MPPRRKLSDLDRGRAIGWLQDGVAARQVAQRLAVAPSVIIRLKQRFHATGRVQERQGSGRPRVTTQREDRFILRQAMQQRMATANNIRQRLQATPNTVVSGETIRNRLHNFGLRARRPVRGTTLTANHRAARRAWCTQHVRWQRQQWARVLFTDESRFCLEPADGRIRVWRRHGERFAEGAVLERQRFGGGSVMVWGGISTRLRTPLYHVVGNLTGVRYQNEILQPLVVPALQAIGPRAILQDDNAPPHRSAAVNTFIQQARVNRMLWPANSPDLNPIEHMWDELCRRVQQHHPPPANLGQLLQWLQQEWNGVPRVFICNLIHSMHQRCVECLAYNGGHTRY